MHKYFSAPVYLNNTFRCINDIKTNKKNLVQGMTKKTKEGIAGGKQTTKTSKTKQKQPEGDH